MHLTTTHGEVDLFYASLSCIVPYMEYALGLYSEDTIGQSVIFGLSIPRDNKENSIDVGAGGGGRG